MGNHRFSNVRACVKNELLENLAIFALLDRIDLCANQFDAVLVENSLLVQGHSCVQCGLTAKSRKNRVWLFLLDNRLDNLRGNRFNIGGVGEVRVGHNRRWV